MSDIAKIANGLTKAQRKVVLTDWRGFHPDHHGKWSSRTAHTQHALYERGLIEADASLAYPTPLGEQVRQYLTENPHG